MSTDSNPVGKLTGSAHVLAVHDLASSREFYQRVLGFQDLKVEAPGWCFMQRDGCRLQIGECPDAMAAGDTGDHSYFAYLYVEQAAALFAHAESRGCRDHQADSGRALGHAGIRPQNAGWPPDHDW